jgi:hypothetical protein
MEKDDDYQDWKKKEGSKWSDISRKAPPFLVFLIPLLILGGNYLVQLKQIPRGFFFVVVISFGILFIFIILREGKEPKLIPEHIIKRIVTERMEQKRKEGIEIPFDAKIKVTLLAGSGYETDMVNGTSGVVKREVGVEVTRNYLKKSYVVSVSPFSGIILDIIPRPLGLSNKDALGKDRLLIPLQFLDKGNN